MTVPLEERLRHRGLAARPRSHSQHQEAFLSFSGQAPVLRHSASSLTSDSSTLLSSKGPGALGATALTAALAHWLLLLLLAGVCTGEKR